MVIPNSQASCNGFSWRTSAGGLKVVALMRSNYILLSSRIIYYLSYILYTCRRIEDFCLDKKQLFAGGWLAGALLQMASGCPLMVSGSEKVWVLILQQWD